MSSNFQKGDLVWYLGRHESTIRSLGAIRSPLRVLEVSAGEYLCGSCTVAHKRVARIRTDLLEKVQWYSRYAHPIRWSTARVMPHDAPAQFCRVARVTSTSGPDLSALNWEVHWERDEAEPPQNKMRPWYSWERYKTLAVHPITLRFGDDTFKAGEIDWYARAQGEEPAPHKSVGFEVSVELNYEDLELRVLNNLQGQGREFKETCVFVFEDSAGEVFKMPDPGEGWELVEPFYGRSVGVDPANLWEQKCALLREDYVNALGLEGYECQVVSHEEGLCWLHDMGKILNDRRVKTIGISKWCKKAKPKREEYVGDHILKCLW